MMAGETLRVIIVDDESLARAVVREYLAAHPQVEIVAECANGFDAVKAVSELAPDLMFLDVQMPKLDGFEVLELLGRDVSVIFTTAYDKYALQAFDVHAVDYLLKPFSEERFAEALSRARERLAARDGTGEGTTADLHALVSAARARQGPLERVLIRDGVQVHVLPVDRIDFVEAQDDYVSFVADGKSYLKDQTMASGGGVARRVALRAHSPIVSPEHRTDRARRAVRERQPDRDPPGRAQAAGQPGGLRAAGEAAVASTAWSHAFAGDHEIRSGHVVFGWIS